MGLGDFNMFGFNAEMVIHDLDDLGTLMTSHDYSETSIYWLNLSSKFSILNPCTKNLKALGVYKTAW